MFFNKKPIYNSSFDTICWFSRLQSDIIDLKKRDIDICRCLTNYQLELISEDCVKVMIEIIPRDSVYKGSEFRVNNIYCDWILNFR